MDPGHSLCNQTSSLIELPLCDTSNLKRCNPDLESEIKANKKRRSSLSCHRRSITGPMLSPPLEAQELKNCPEADVNTCKSQTEETGQTSSSLMPNPSNLNMDKVIAEMNAQIKKLDNEYEEWKNLLKDFEEKETQSKNLSMNLELSMDDIPESIKEYARAHYLPIKPLDLLATKNHVDQLLLQAQFNRESCVRDVKLVQYVVQTIQAKNKILAAEFAQAFDLDIMKSEDSTIINSSKDLVEKFANC